MIDHFYFRFTEEGIIILAYSFWLVCMCWYCARFLTSKFYSNPVLDFRDNHGFCMTCQSPDCCCFYWLYFLWHLCSEKPWKIEVISLSGAKGKHAQCPFKKNSVLQALVLSVIQSTVCAGIIWLLCLVSHAVEMELETVQENSDSWLQILPWIKINCLQLRSLGLMPASMKLAGSNFGLQVGWNHISFNSLNSSSNKDEMLTDT